MKNQQILQLKSLTTPLFHDHHYYYQGRPKTQIRGIPHLIGAIIVIPISYYIIFTNRPDHEYLKPPALIFALGTIICWIVSYLYHTIEQGRNAPDSIPPTSWWILIHLSNKRLLYKK